MSCFACGHRWCWVCGLPLYHWSHKMSEYMPFTCKRVPTSAIGWFFNFIIFLLGILLIPLIIFLIGTFTPVYFCVDCQYKCFRCLKNLSRCRKGSDCALFCCFAVPYLLIWIALGLALGSILGALAVGLLTIPAVLFHTFYFFRTCWWWFTTSRVKE
jgi:hypothetical protein